MFYPAYVPMLEAARAYPALWRLVAGVITAIVLTFVWLGVVILGLAASMQAHPLAAARAALGGPADSPERAIFYLMVVAGLGFSTIASAWMWQGRGRRDLIGQGPQVIRHFLLAAGVTLTLAAILTSLQSLVADAAPLERNLPLSAWLAWLPFAIIALGFQTGAEEVFFRGYLQSQLAARFRSPIIWLLVPSIAFGFAHFAPGLPGANSWLYVGYAALFGVLAGDLTARTGSLGAAWGWHFANNSFAVLFVATEGSVTGLGLLRAPGGLTEPIAISPALLFDVAIVVGIWFIIRRILRV